MSKRVSFLIVGGLGCLVLLACVAALGLAGYAYYVTALAPRTVDRIAYVDNSSNIQVVDGQGEHHVALTTDASDSVQRIYMFPTWSPDSQKIAFVGVSGDGRQREGTLNVASVVGGNLTTIFKSGLQLPFYLYWAPDSQRIGFLAQGENEMALMLGHGTGQEQARKLNAGSPMYWSWSPDSHTLLMHVGGSSHDSQDAHMALLSWQEGNDARNFSDQPATFQAPQFSPDGAAMLYASTGNDDQDALFLADSKGANPKTALPYTGTIAFAWSPDGKKIAALVTPMDSELPMSGPITALDADGSNPREIITEDALAFYWSPDGKQIAYLTILLPGQSNGCLDCDHVSGLSTPSRQDAQIMLRWKTFSLVDGQVRTLATFQPTDNFISILPFFDQYARSLTFWSPDSKHFVYTQAEGASDGSVWVADLDGGTQPHKVGDGTLAVWSWK